MDELLKGNFETKKKVVAEPEAEGATLEDRFEKEVMKRLGGSMAFVSKQKVVWDLDEEDDA